MRINRRSRETTIRYNLESIILLPPLLSKSTMNHGSYEQSVPRPEVVSPPSPMLFVYEIVNVLYPEHQYLCTVQ
ncbi:uncharacterized protein A1O5_11943 [Cladophialophora psammophila CBS 110553]|uniref:Uncharacterized protein n=1 Tax=Cladophialophora psammophila CBS 110553 TaxID=1182543 RepID=W9W9E8_9EURO|nr:uncharacterized protein A1O5_11943 [Cladophialophora psammophila CBS 110553]EXJ61151.1 hypothetical protein A1O5_11943 [Cladophialophora psammophila CBS 110553]